MAEPTDTTEVIAPGSPENELRWTISERIQELVEYKGAHMDDPPAYTDSIFNLDRIFAYLDSNLVLASDYMPLIESLVARRATHGRVNLSAIFKTFTDHPAQAVALRDIFQEVPELISTYSSFSLQPEADLDNGVVVTRGNHLLRSRISDTTDFTRVRHYLDRNSGFVRDIYEKMGDKEWIVTAQIEAMGELCLQKINPTISQLRALRILLRPLEGNRVDFLPWEFTVTAGGIVSVYYGIREPTGYLLMERQGINELKLLQSLIQHPFASEELATALGAFQSDEPQGGPGIIEYILK